MKGDFTRNTFDRARHYSGVRMQQGRVQLDADWNEQRDIDAYRDRTTHRDVIGHCGGPQGRDSDGNELAGFGIRVAGDDLRIGAGRYYVDGLLVENEAEASIGAQPDLPGYDPLATLDAGVYLAYLDAWERHITALEDGDIREVALGGPDTATRTQVVAQVRLERVGEPGEAVDCSDFGPDWAPADAASSGRLAARAEPADDAGAPCIVPPNAGYRRLENQLYRVEIHSGGGVDEASFKWSRENGSIVTRWESQDGGRLTVSSVGKDDLLRFSAGDWVELSDDRRELQGRPGVLVRLLQVEDKVLTIDPDTIQDPDDPSANSVDRADFPLNPKIRRWESDGAESVAIPAGDDGWIELEDGVWVHFQAGGVYRSGDYWMIPARTALGDVLWPDDPATNEPEFQPRHGIAHRYCPLAIIERGANGWEEPDDCRKTFPPLTGLPSAEQGCCTHSVGDGVHSIGDFQSIQAAVDALDPKQGGVICILPGVYPLKAPVSVQLPFIAIHGCGRQARITANSGGPAFVIGNARDGVQLRDLVIQAAGSRGVVRIEDCVGVRIEDCELSDRGAAPGVPIARPLPPGTGRRPGEVVIGVDGARPRPRGVMLRSEPAGPALHIRGGREILIRACHLLGRPALSIQARGLDIRNNRCLGGGIWLWDGCGDGTIAGNEIGEGQGPGIALGGLPEGEDFSKEVSGLLRITVRENHIHGMINSGIGSVASGEEAGAGELEDIVIAHNRIESCARGGLDPAWDPLAVGGVVVRNAMGLRIHDNLIEHNTPVAGGAAVGVFTYLCHSLEIGANRIVGNGAPDTPGADDAVHCVDFRDAKPSSLPNPLATRQGLSFTVFKDRDEPVTNNQIAQKGVFTGLDAGRATDIELPEAVSVARVSLVAFNPSGSVAAFDAGGRQLAEAPTTAERGLAQTLTLTGKGITRLRVRAPESELLILEICAGERQTGGFQAGIAAWYVLGGDDSSDDRPAAMIHGNSVSTPRGPALVLVGIGPMMIADNHFSSQGSHVQPPLDGGEEFDPMDRIAMLGECVTLLNLGAAMAFPNASLALSMTTVTHHAIGAGAAVPTLPVGAVRFDGNQVEWNDTEGVELAGASVALLSFDDISAQHNQLYARAPHRLLFSDLFTAAPSLRVNGNALSELPNRAVFSCISISIRQNLTTANQATHCILPLGNEVIHPHNQVQIQTALCERLIKITN